MIRLYSASTGLVLEHAGQARLAASLTLDAVFAAADPGALVRSAWESGLPSTLPAQPGAPIGTQEVWAAGVTYLRSRTARMEESKDAGGGTFYDKVYHAVRPELFFKGTPHRVAGPGTAVRIRGDSQWNVPEPELTLAINKDGRIFGYTVGNDMSSRDIEGENPLYLPQAKVYDRSTGLGPCLLVTDAPLPPTTTIAIEIRRDGAAAFSGSTQISQIKRAFPELAEFLFRDNSFPRGAYLMTGTGIVPPDAFTLRAGDEIRITIEPIGTLVNTVA
ncbi:Fumarylacetoacetate (FAA) hydrolase family protein [Lacunisphaera limnophila]|uniref:Fumarylacetoacetate (FAA) hydrolase family protein n=1 Tax=Lacunisphaera limnophila TaxID=1838286 RepID=A0A1D8AUX5_9BACT|nr:fumarylacetoacetate hydrolase family protein [Lacunisphaera limnophila]AOS44682.1 Fumarylacetoacetate (FAA) hydrolase family protein [Lacunisphaera limnophila]